MRSRTVVRTMSVGLAMASGLVFAQQQQEIVVESPRVQVTRAPYNSGDIPIDVITVSHVVSYSNIDISTSSGAKVLEQRIKDAAKAACKEIDTLYPTRKPITGDLPCEKTATDAAMVRANAAIAATEKARNK